MMAPLHITPIARLLRDYAFAYTAAHDITVCDRIMVDEYTLIMGPFEARGRDDNYKPAALKQFEQYPGLGFTVVDLVTNGDRAAMIFCEHGQSTRFDRSASWLGISLYEWNGSRLTQCRVEQDYFSRTQQTDTGVPLPVPRPAMDPWAREALPSEADAVHATTQWLRGDWWKSPIIFDDEDCNDPRRARFDDATTTVLDIFSAGHRVAFHVRVDGVYSGGLDRDGDTALVGSAGSLYATGIVDVDNGTVSTGRVVTDRLSLLRRLRAATK